MRPTFRTIVLVAVIALVSTPRAAHAEGFVVPWIGAAFSQTDFGTASDRKPSFGAGLGSMGGGGIFGFDVDFGYTPSFFGSEASTGTNSLITLTGNVIVGPSIEGSAGRGVRPYGNFGLGLVHPKIAATSENDFGWDAGGGLMIFVSSRIGVRGDVKYFHTVNNTTFGNTITLAPGSFHFWRAYAGLIIR